MPKPQNFNEWLADIKALLGLFWVVVIKRQPLFGIEKLKTINQKSPPNPPPPGVYWVPQSVFQYGQPTTWVWVEIVVPENPK